MILAIVSIPDDVVGGVLAVTLVGVIYLARQHSKLAERVSALEGRFKERNSQG